MDQVIRFATGNFPLSLEMQGFWMAVQGTVAVRLGPNRNGNLHWFHAFILSVMAAFSGGWLGFLWMAKPSSMLSNDINMASCILSFIIVNYTPRDIGFTICRTLPVTLITTIFAQLFRSVGIMKFVTACFESFKDNPSEYYPIPIFGPILYATLLGNMAGIVVKGLDGHIANGMPWPVQNGLFCATFYHFYVNDKTGPIGEILRNTTFMGKELLGEMEDREFAACVVTYFMQVMGILQLPQFMGPKFSPFGLALLNPWKDSSTWTVGKTESEYSRQQKEKKREKEEEEEKSKTDPKEKQKKAKQKKNN